MKPPFVITGSGRCGTTLVRRLLVERTNVVIPPENYVLYLTPRLHKESRSWDEFVGKIVAALSATQSWRELNMDADVLRDNLLSIPQDRRSRLELWNVFHESWAASNNIAYSHHWGDKTPRAALYLGAVKATLPDARFLFLVRDPYDVIRSYLKMGVDHGEIEEIAGRWARSNENILKVRKRFPRQCLMLKYEDLVSDNDRVMERIIAHIGADEDRSDANSVSLDDIESVPHFQNVRKDVFSDSVGKGMEFFSPDQKIIIESIVGDVRRTMRY